VVEKLGRLSDWWDETSVKFGPLLFSLSMPLIVAGVECLVFFLYQLYQHSPGWHITVVFPLYLDFYRNGPESPSA
jgi:hypothetical protein